MWWKTALIQSKVTSILEEMHCGMYDEMYVSNEVLYFCKSFSSQCLDSIWFSLQNMEDHNTRHALVNTRIHQGNSNEESIDPNSKILNKIQS